MTFKALTGTGRLISTWFLHNF